MTHGTEVNSSLFSLSCLFHYDDLFHFLPFIQNLLIPCTLTQNCSVHIQITSSWDFTIVLWFIFYIDGAKKSMVLVRRP